MFFFFIEHIAVYEHIFGEVVVECYFISFLINWSVRFMGTFEHIFTGMRLCCTIVHSDFISHIRFFQ